VTLDEFQQLVPPFEAAFQARMAAWRMGGKPRTARRFTVDKNCPLPTPEDRLLFILIYLKTYALQVVHGRLFGMMQGKANQWIHGLLPVLLAALRALGDAPAPLPHGPKCFQREIAESIAGRRVEVCGLSRQVRCYAAGSAWKHLAQRLTVDRLARRIEHLGYRVHLEPVAVPAA